MATKHHDGPDLIGNESLGMGRSLESLHSPFLRQSTTALLLPQLESRRSTYDLLRRSRSTLTTGVGRDNAQEDTQGGLNDVYDWNAAARYWRACHADATDPSSRQDSPQQRPVLPTNLLRRTTLRGGNGCESSLMEMSEHGTATPRLLRQGSTVTPDGNPPPSSLSSSPSDNQTTPLRSRLTLATPFASNPGNVSPSTTSTVAVGTPDDNRRGSRGMRSKASLNEENVRFRYSMR